MANKPRPNVWELLLTWGILAMLVYLAGKKRARGQNPPNDNGVSQTGIWPWISTWAIIVIFIYTTLVNPGGLLGESRTVNLFVFELPTYKGQGTVLQFIGTFIVALGLVTRLSSRREINKVTTSGIIGGIGIMVGLLMQTIQENPLLALVLILMLFYISFFWILLWILLGVLYGIKWSYSRTRAFFCAMV